MGVVILQAVLAVVLAITQTQPTSDARVASIQVKGTRRYSPADVTRLSGVEIGKPATVADLTAAATRLAATGLFNSVRFSYTTGTRQMTVIFDIEEAAWTIPVIFDNLVWLPEPQLIAALAEEVPSFDGTAPVNVGAADFLTRALEKILKARHIPGRVEFVTQGDLKGSLPKYMFAVKDPAPTVCALHVDGATAIPEREQISQLGAVVGGEYSKFFLSTAARGTLTDMYRRKGLWRAEFGPPLAALDACQGVAVTLTVKEGAVYTWDRAEWSGPSALGVDALNQAMGMKSGEPADATKIEAGLREVSAAYGKQGYIAQRATFEPRLDDASHKAVFAIAVVEGAQFHMGTLEFAGIRESDAAMLAKKWRLKSGDVYDESAAKKYEFEELLPLRTSSGARARMEMHLDNDQRLVNLTIVFK
jgi:outer membrane protein insertion porin family